MRPKVDRVLEVLHSYRAIDNVDGLPHINSEKGRNADTSGPLKTLGSFMSFQTYRLGVEPWYAFKSNCFAHQLTASGFIMSIYTDDPGQHHLQSSGKGSGMNQQAGACLPDLCLGHVHIG